MLELPAHLIVKGFDDRRADYSLVAFDLRLLIVLLVLLISLLPCFINLPINSSVRLAQLVTSWSSLIVCFCFVLVNLYRRLVWRVCVCVDQRFRCIS